MEAVALGGMVRIWARVEENPMPLMIVGRKVLKDTPGIAELKKRKEISASIVAIADSVLGDSQQEYRYVKVCLGVPYRLDNKFLLELLGTCGVVLPDGLEKPSPLCVGKERCVLRVLPANECQGGSRKLRYRC